MLTDTESHATIQSNPRKMFAADFQPSWPKIFADTIIKILVPLKLLVTKIDTTNFLLMKL